jgi:hypothetical protein
VAEYVDALIPGAIGLLLVIAPELFTNARGSAGEAAKSRIRGAGFMALFASAALMLTKT